MRVAVAQTEPKLGEKERNLEVCLARLEEAAAAGAQLLVLTECALPGYMFDSGDEVTVQAGDEGIRFLLVSGKPIEDPVAWYGPIVMNTQEQLREAYAELRNGTFIK